MIVGTHTQTKFCKVPLSCHKSHGRSSLLKFHSHNGAVLTKKKKSLKLKKVFKNAKDGLKVW